MSGFNTLDDVIKANSVNNRGQRWDFSKLAAGNYTSGRAFSLWPNLGTPGPGSFPGTNKTSTVYNSSSAGAMPFSNPGTGRTNHLTAFLAQLSSSVEGDLYLVDRLLSYDQWAVNTTADQAVVSNVATLTRYTNGIGNKILVEVDVNLSANAGTLEVYYTNTAIDTPASTINRVGAAMTLQSSATAFSSGVSPCSIPYAAGVFHNMQGSDRGVTKIDKVKLPTSTFISGQLCVSIVHPIWSIPIIKGQQVDLLSQVVHAQKIEDGACLQFIFVPHSTSAPTVTGSVLTTEN